MGDNGPQVVPLNSETALAFPVDSPNPDGASRWFPATGSPTSGNRVAAFISAAAETYPEMGRAIRRATGGGDFVYLLGWDFHEQTNLGGATVGALLREASNNRGVAVRAMLYFHQAPGPGIAGSGPGLWFERR